MPDTGLQIILSHEHTDFDALASMFAASLVFPDALPVLPRQLNRNVASFLTLYRNHFPFITDKDLPRADVTHAILVDARTVNWVKGMDAKTPQTIIDHHADDETPAPHQRLWYAAVGANTTLLVEKLMEQSMTLSSLHATLLALGIHEDTGSLTYASTTFRDARALSWLLEPERGVNLGVLSQFLNHPLSRPQRDLLQKLIDHSEFVEVAGHTVVIAEAEAVGFREELSALASRLRDFHETDAIFMVVDLGDIIQVVARSTTDNVDVGKITAELGGGVQARAPAAPIHNADLGTHAIRDRIVELLTRHSRAAVTVGDIMSHGRPQALPPGMTVEAAAELMRRYGHEGFPVVRKRPDGSEEILGVLTRREADRALNHDLGAQPISRYMRAGDVHISPDASTTELRRLMIDSNWGQIPVVDAQGRITGIVTRTDLIKLWDVAALPQSQSDAVAEKLRASLAPVQYALLRLVGEKAHALGHTVYVVGGFVRDLLLNGRRLDVAALDMDIVIEGNAMALAHGMMEHYGGRVVLHRRFNTAKWLLDDPGHPVAVERLLTDLQVEGTPTDLPAHLDFVTARTEFYTAPTVLPTVEDSSIKLDLHRRDFTINTLALCLDPDRWGELLDFYGGLNDLRQGVVRVLHSLSFVDDPTRILRAVRYEQRFGFAIDARTQELLLDAVELLDRVTPARIRHELERILQEERPEAALARLADLGVMQRLHPDLVVDEWVRRRYADLRVARSHSAAGAPLLTEPLDRLYWGVLVYRLDEPAHTALTARLGLRAETQRLMQGLRRLHRAEVELDAVDLPPSRVVAILDAVDPVAVALAPVVCADRSHLMERIAYYRTVWHAVHPVLDGHDLAAMGIPRGPLYGELLTALRAALLDGAIQTRAEEVAWVQRYLATASRSTPTGSATG